MFKIRTHLPQSNLITISKYIAVFEVFSHRMLMTTTEGNHEATSRYGDVL